MNRHLSKEDIQMANTWKDAQHHSSSGKYKSKPHWDTTSHQSEWLKLTQKQQMLARMCRNGNPLALLVGMQTCAAGLENSVEVCQKIKNRTTLWPSNCSTRYLSKGYKNADSKGHMHSNVYTSTINNSQIMERTQMSIDWWMDKEDVICIYIYIHTQWNVTRWLKRTKSCHLQQPGWN